jgi:hypothetical protein
MAPSLAQDALAVVSGGAVAVSGLVTIAALFIGGGLVGGFFGMRAAVHLAANRRDKDCLILGNLS